MVTELTPDNATEVHEDWLLEIRRRLNLNYGDSWTFSQDNNIDYLSVRRFLEGNPVPEDLFKEICGVLDFDWEKVQSPL
jgi:hypothetical protein